MDQEKLAQELVRLISIVMSTRIALGMATVEEMIDYATEVADSLGVTVEFVKMGHDGN